MTVLLISQIFPPHVGGSGRWFWEIYRRWPREDVVVAAGMHPRAEGFDASHELRVRRMPLDWGHWGIASVGGLAGYLRARRAIRRLIREYEVDQIHCGTILTEGLVAWLAGGWRGMPYTVYVHGEELNIGAGSRELRLLMRRVLGDAQRVVANSRNTSRLLTTDWLVPEAKVKILHPGVDIERFTPAEPCEATRRRLGWDGRTVVLTVGRLQPRKGHDMLLRAIPRLVADVPDLLYTIVGDGEQRGFLENLVEQLDIARYVQFRGQTTDQELVEAYQQCDLFVLPNREIDGDIEGFGMVLLEAQACGKPVVAGDSGGTVETLRPGDTGRIVSCEQPEPLGDVLRELLTDASLRQAMGRAARSWVEDRFGWEALTAQSRSILQ